MNTISDNLTFLPNDIIPIHNLYHPYAFVGIPNIGPGNGYESIKSNKGHYLTVEGLPYAELNVRLKFNRITRNYQFDYEQVIDVFIFSIIRKLVLKTTTNYYISHMTIP